MDKYVLDFVESTKRKLDVEGPLPEVQYLGYIDCICEPYHMADNDDEALLILDCIADVFKRRWERTRYDRDADISAYALIVESAFRSSETIKTINKKNK